MIKHLLSESEKNILAKLSIARYIIGKVRSGEHTFDMYYTQIQGIDEMLTKYEWDDKMVITELRTDFIDDQNLRHVDCWFDNNDDSEGRTIAVVDLDTKKVIFFDNRYRMDSTVKLAIEDILKDI